MFPKCSGALARQPLGFPAEDQKEHERQKIAEGRTIPVCTPPMSQGGANAGDLPSEKKLDTAPRHDLDARGWLCGKLAGQTCLHCHLVFSTRCAVTVQFWFPFPSVGPFCTEP